MKKILLLACLLVAFKSYSQIKTPIPLQMNKTDLETQINLDIFGNTTQLITGANLQELFLNTNESAINRLTDLAVLPTGLLKNTIGTGALSIAVRGIDFDIPDPNLSLSSTFTTAGGFPLTLITTSATSITLPASGVLVSTTVTSLPLLTGIGTVTQGSWHGVPIGTQYGGTGTDMSTMTGLVKFTQGIASTAIFKDIGAQNYAGTIVWTGAAPKGTLYKEYSWSQIGKTVTLIIEVNYSIPGAANTQVTFSLPTDCPSPIVIATLGANASEKMVAGDGYMDSAKTGTPPTDQRVWLRKNANNNGYEIVITAPAINAILGVITITYRTN